MRNEKTVTEKTEKFRRALLVGRGVLAKPMDLWNHLVGVGLWSLCFVWQLASAGSKAVAILILIILWEEVRWACAAAEERAKKGAT